jgi:hypothetical protein
MFDQAFGRGRRRRLVDERRTERRVGMRPHAELRPTGQAAGRQNRRKEAQILPVRENGELQALAAEGLQRRFQKVRQEEWVGFDGAFGQPVDPLGHARQGLDRLKGKRAAARQRSGPPDRRSRDSLSEYHLHLGPIYAGKEQYPPPSRS